ncbi:DUF4244 domain-containing protein [Actinomadura livida]|uniref:Flp pilus assembly pilin Flp n=1 Tax=Actinomadura livida TaxID=79909 RepID=A0A7W7IA13_9ACTN|nr:MULTISPECIES: DUF4244 domain-containing protein [Actinomadura]MBB4773297.1 Flp pilus assembly pilin Flp [Actinomadura catellatispora]GGU33232.1 hypothetical protein GCM10010208_67310 [Actinomadura livida]
MNSLIPLYVTLQTFVQDRAERLKERSDRGVSALEYGALIVVAALVVGILYSLINGSVRTSVSNAITKLFNPGGGGSS